MLYLLKSGACQTRLEVAETLAVHRNTIGRWLKRYEHGGLNALMTIEEPGAKPGQKDTASSGDRFTQGALERRKRF